MKKSPFAAVDPFETKTNVNTPQVVEQRVDMNLDYNGDNVVDEKDSQMYDNMVENNKLLNIFSLLLRWITKGYGLLVLIFLIPIMLQFNFLTQIWFFFLPILLVELFVGAILVTINHFCKGRFIKQVKLILLLIAIGMIVFQLTKYLG